MFTSGLSVARTGIIKKPGRLESWAAKEVPSNNVVESVADALFSDYKHSKRYWIKVLNSIDGLTFHENTGMECVGG